MADKLTALRTIDGSPATKRHIWSDGNWQTESYSSGQHFAWSQADVSSIESLSARLSAIEGKPSWFIVRGEPTRGVKYLRRVYKGDDPHFEPVDRRWICIDIDGLEVPDGVGHVDHAVHTLPSYFHGVSVFWQHSASAGIRDDGKAHLHLWYWLNRPVCDFSLREWAKGLRGEYGTPVDSMLYNPVQPHYTALPIIEGAPDPISKRSGLLKGERDELVLPESVVDLEAWVKQREAERKASRDRRRKAAKRARLNPNAPKAQKAYAISALNSACVKIETAPVGDRHRVIFSQSAGVAELFHTGYLDPTEARCQLENAAFVAIGDEGRQAEAVRTVAQGIDTGLSSPRDISHVGAGEFEGSQTDEGWLDHHHPITCKDYERSPSGCAHYLDGGACSREDQFMCAEWMKLNPAHSHTDTPPREHWSSNE